MRYRIFPINTIRTNGFNLRWKPSGHFDVLDETVYLARWHANEMRNKSNRNWNIFVKWQFSRYAVFILALFFLSIIDATLSNHTHRNWLKHCLQMCTGQLVPLWHWDQTNGWDGQQIYRFIVSSSLPLLCLMLSVLCASA